MIVGRHSLGISRALTLTTNSASAAWLRFRPASRSTQVPRCPQSASGESTSLMGSVTTSLRDVERCSCWVGVPGADVIKENQGTTDMCMSALKVSFAPRKRLRRARALTRSRRGRQCSLATATSTQPRAMATSSMSGCLVLSARY